MKKHYENPQAVVEEFVANQYVAGCYNYTASLYCATPGSSTTVPNDGSTVQWGVDGLQHGGPCASGSTVTINGNGTEQSGKEGTTSYAITDFHVGEEVNAISVTCTYDSYGTMPETLQQNHYYRCQWKSSDGANTYKHFGTMKITSAVEEIAGRPNHS